MQPLDKNALFSIFEAGDEQVYQENNVSDLLDNPYVLIGMVVRGVENWYLMDLMYKRSYPQQYTKVRRTIQRRYFLRLVSYLERLDINTFSTVYTIGDSFDSQEVHSTFNMIIKYFESIEMYEQCATVKSYLDLLDHEHNTKDLLKYTGVKLPN